MEGEQLKPVPVDLKELSSLYPDTWTGIAQMRAVLALSNEALQASGVELVPVYDGEPLDDAEVIDRPRHGLVTMDDAADTVMDARADELEHLSLFLDKLRVISHTSMYRYLYIRRTHINRLADRPPEGDSDGTTTK